jgi:RNA polymerase sigma-70 factor (ECF subfamily)
VTPEAGLVVQRHRGRWKEPSVVELNRAAAIAEAGDVEAALALVERLELDRYHCLHATRAELLRRLDRLDDARSAYDRALELVHSDAERRFLERRLADLEG